MITHDQAETLREQLMQVLSEDAHNTQRLLARLDSITHESGIGAHSALLLILTHLAFEEGEARRHWQAVLSLREQLSLSLGRDAGVRVALLDYFVNVNRRLVRPTLIELEMIETSSRDADKDRLTGLADERSFRTALQRELRRARRYSQRSSIVLFDLDDFAAANLRFGDLVGDRLLREAAILLSNKIRDIDLAARPGEDELALLLPETDRNGALLVAERFRREFEEFFAGRESSGTPVNLTLSAGVACYPDDATSPEGLLACAAQALYHAKAEGKNEVQVFRPERRRFLRFDLPPGRFEVEVLPAGDSVPVRLRNFSRNGVLFLSPEPLQVGEEIEIRLADPGHQAAAQALRIRGRVVRLEELPPAIEAEDPSGPSPSVASDPFEIGVAFDLDWAEGGDDLLEFLEMAQDRKLGSGT